MTQYAVAHAEVAHERVDDEVIVINLRTGAYFSLVGPAADAWDLLIAGIATAQIAATIAGRYGTSERAVAADLDGFVAALLHETLLTDAPGASASPVELPPPAPGTAYRGPTLDKYDDMEELLLLDPIHEVDESGWPVVAAEPLDA